MSKLAGYPEEDKAIIKDVMSYAVEVQMGAGVIAESDDAIRSAMPAMFEAAKQAVDYLLEMLRGQTGLDIGSMNQLKHLSMTFFMGRIEKAKASISSEEMLAWMKSSVLDARSTICAVDEYLAG